MESKERGVALKEAMIAALECFGADGKQLQKMVTAENDPIRLGLMYQTMREVYLKEFANSEIAPFKVKMPDGSVQDVKNLSDLDKLARAEGAPV